MIELEEKTCKINNIELKHLNEKNVSKSHQNDLDYNYNHNRTLLMPKSPTNMSKSPTNMSKSPKSKLPRADHSKKNDVARACKNYENLLTPNFLKKQTKIKIKQEKRRMEMLLEHKMLSNNIVKNENVLIPGNKIKLDVNKTIGVLPTKKSPRCKYNTRASADYGIKNIKNVNVARASPDYGIKNANSACVDFCDDGDDDNDGNDKNNDENSIESLLNLWDIYQKKNNNNLNYDYSTYVRTYDNNNNIEQENIVGLPLRRRAQAKLSDCGTDCGAPGEPFIRDIYPGEPFVREPSIEFNPDAITPFTPMNNTQNYNTPTHSLPQNYNKNKKLYSNIKKKIKKKITPQKKPFVTRTNIATPSFGGTVVNKNKSKSPILQHIDNVNNYLQTVCFFFKPRITYFSLAPNCG